MSTLTRTIDDSTTMLRRNLLHMRRYPSMTGLLVGMPIIFLLLFVYVFGGTLGAGLPGGGGRDAYIDYVVPGILLMAVAAVAQGTAISVAMDMTEGVIARFRTMDIARSSVLTGHVLGAMIQTLLVLIAVLGVALAIGFRPTGAGVMDWLGAFGILMLLAFGLTWLCVALGLAADTVETASNTPMPLVLLPFLGSGFVPTDSMPTILRWFAEHQPFTPVMDTVRGLLLDQQVGTSWIEAVAWCAVIALASYAWARRLYARDPVRI